MSTWETPSDQPGDQFAAGDDRFEWIDGQGRRWTIVADAAGVSLQCQDERIEIPRERFAADLYVSPMGEQVVVRFADADQEVGFLVGRSAAAGLLGRLGYDPTTPDQLVEAARKAVPTARPPWPQMSGRAVAGLICATLSFQPFIGVGFGLAAAYLILVERVRRRPSPATLHIRWMGTISAWLTVWGLVVWALSTWTWFQPLEVGPMGGRSSLLGDYTPTTWILAIVVVLVSLSVHEAGHAISAWWCGDDYARSLGRVTLNPKAHIDLFGTILLPSLLLWAGAPVFGYAKPVPVRLGGIRRFRRAHILISIAGPGSNLLLAALSLSLLLAAGCVLRHFVPLETLLDYANLLSVNVQLTGFPLASVVAVLLCGLKLMFLINVMLAAFNLLPIPPLDGSWVLEHLFPRTLGRLYARIRPFGFLVFLALFYTEVLDALIVPVVVVVLVIDALFGLCIVG